MYEPPLYPSVTGQTFTDLCLVMNNKMTYINNRKRTEREMLKNVFALASIKYLVA